MSRFAMILMRETIARRKRAGKQQVIEQDAVAAESERAADRVRCPARNECPTLSGGARRQ
jgi:hypothetical protein